MSNVDLTPEERAKIVAERADVKYGPFASLHEAYGVIAEELHESNSAILDFHDVNETMPPIESLLESLQSNDHAEFARIVKVGRSGTRAKLLILKEIEAELIDLIAVCDRIIAQWGEK